MGQADFVSKKKIHKKKFQKKLRKNYRPRSGSKNQFYVRSITKLVFIFLLKILYSFFVKNMWLNKVGFKDLICNIVTNSKTLVILNTTYLVHIIQNGKGAARGDL